MIPPHSLSRPTSTLIAIAAAIIVLAGIKAAASITGPLFFAIFLAVIFGMLLHWLEKKGLAPWSALAVTLAIFFAILAVFVVIIAGSFLQLLSDLPSYQSELEESIGLIGPLLTQLGIDPGAISLNELAASLSSGLSGLAGYLWNLTVLAALTLATTLFLLMEAKGFSRKLELIIGELHPGEFGRFTALAQKNVDYLVIRVWVNLAMGVGTGIILALIGVKYAIFWAFLAFLLGFVPYIGFWLAVIPPMLLAWFDLGPVPALLVLAGSGGLNLLVEYLMFPHLASRGLALSTSVVFISLFFWGWILGGIGVLLAVPLTLFVQTVCELYDETHWIAVLLGPVPLRDRGIGGKAE